MDKLLDIKIQDLAKADFANIQLFQSYHLDFFCKGNLTLEEALMNAEVQPTEFLKKLSAIQEDPQKKYEVDVAHWPLDLLADYIQKTHHRFTDQLLINIREKIIDSLKEGIQESKEIEQIKVSFEQLAQELGAHMKREELILFPMIKKIIAVRGKLENPREKSVKQPVDKMIHEHDTQFLLVKEIKRLLGSNSLNESVSKEYKEIAALLNELFLDLSLHLHLENNILFPKAVELEKQKLN